MSHLLVKYVLKYHHQPHIFHKKNQYMPFLIIYTLSLLNNIHKNKRSTFFDIIRQLDTFHNKSPFQMLLNASKKGLFNFR